MHNMRPDLIILDEAQRIQLGDSHGPHHQTVEESLCLVLTGTPRKQLEELYSVVEFVDGRRLGPAFRFLKEHRIENEEGNYSVTGLEKIHNN